MSHRWGAPGHGLGAARRHVVAQHDGVVPPDVRRDQDLVLSQPRRWADQRRFSGVGEDQADFAGLDPDQDEVHVQGARPGAQ